MDEKIRILLVDDEYGYTQSMSLWFQSRGYSVMDISSGMGALELIRNNPPDAIFLDIVMPGMDGPTVLRKIREFNKTVLVIMMSSYVKESRVKKDDNLYGVCGIFYKCDGFEKALFLLKSALSQKKETNKQNQEDKGDTQ